MDEAVQLWPDKSLKDDDLTIFLRAEQGKQNRKANSRISAVLARQNQVAQSHTTRLEGVKWLRNVT